MQLVQRVTTTFLVKTVSGAKIGLAKSSARSCKADDLRIAIFHRVKTMPTFPDHWAACSGSVEEGENPWQCAQRELSEETNYLIEDSEEPVSAGLFLDVPYVSPRSQKERTIRVYPFIVAVPESFDLSLKGTEHDKHKWVSLAELDNIQPTVPSLALAFHHAFCGQYYSKITMEERTWATDRENGATTMARRALELLASTKGTGPGQIAMLRPSMVTIVNCMNAVQNLSNSVSQSVAAEKTLASLLEETNRAVRYSVGYILKNRREKKRPLSVCTFSRSSTLVAILKTILDEHEDCLALPILCSKSTPGDEGFKMAMDLNGGDENGTIARCIDDDLLLDKVKTTGEIDIILIGADCVLADGSAIVNKIGTSAIAAASSSSTCKVICSTDRFKLWDDIFPPPLEKDLFELIDVPGRIDRLLLPPSVMEGSSNTTKSEKGEA